MQAPERDENAYHLQGTHRMARFVVHRMNNLLGGIMGYAELMIRRAEKAGQDAGQLRQIHEIGITASDMLAHFYTYLHLWDRQGVSGVTAEKLLFPVRDFLQGVFPMMRFEITPSDDTMPIDKMYLDRAAVSEILIHVLAGITILARAESPTRIRFALKKGAPDVTEAVDGGVNEGAGLRFQCEITPPQGFSFTAPHFSGNGDLSGEKNITYKESTLYTESLPQVESLGGTYVFSDDIPPVIHISFPVTIS